MMKNNLELIKKLRKITLAGFSSCKSALEETNYDLDKAIEILQKKGMNKVLKRSNVDRLTNEGRVVVSVKENIAILIEMRCETDFVSNNINFSKFIENVINLSFEEIEKDINLFNIKENKKIKDFILKESSKFGEKIELTDFYFIKKLDNQIFSFYQHTNGKYGSLLVLDGLIDNDTLEGIAMQVVVTRPKFISIFEIDDDFKNRKRSLIEEKINENLKNKSLELRKKIIEDKLEKELKEITLLNQKYIKDESKTIKEILEKNNVKIISMKWFAIGE